MFVIWHGRPWSNPTTVTHWPVFGQASRLMTNRMFCCSIWGDDALPVVSIPEGDGLDDGCLGCTTTYPKTTVVYLCQKSLFICITDETIVMYWCDQRDSFLVQQYTLTEMIKTLHVIFIRWFILLFSHTNISHHRNDVNKWKHIYVTGPLWGASTGHSSICHLTNWVKFVKRWDIGKPQSTPFTKYILMF